MKSLIVWFISILPIVVQAQFYEYEPRDRPIVKQLNINNNGLVLGVGVSQAINYEDIGVLFVIDERGNAKAIEGETDISAADIVDLPGGGYAVCGMFGFEYPTRLNSYLHIYDDNFNLSQPGIGARLPSSLQSNESPSFFEKIDVTSANELLIAANPYYESDNGRSYLVFFRIVGGGYQEMWRTSAGAEDVTGVACIGTDLFYTKGSLIIQLDGSGNIINSVDIGFTITEMERWNGQLVCTYANGARIYNAQLQLTESLALQGVNKLSTAPQQLTLLSGRVAHLYDTAYAHIDSFALPTVTCFAPTAAVSYADTVIFGGIGVKNFALNGNTLTNNASIEVLDVAFDDVWGGLVYDWYYSYTLNLEVTFKNTGSKPIYSLDFGTYTNGVVDYFFYGSVLSVDNLNVPIGGTETVAIRVSVRSDVANPDYFLFGSFLNGSLYSCDSSLNYASAVLFTAIAEQLQASVNVYPNPSTGEFTMYGAKAGWQVVVSNIQGQAVHRQAVDNTTTAIDISVHAHGMYLLQLYDEDGRYISTKKLMVK